MIETKQTRIEQINQKIVSLLLDRAKAQRHGTWADEEKIFKQIEELEKQIKQIEAEP